MATSGSFTFNPTFSQIFDESVERAGIDPAKTTSGHVQSAKMSMNLMFTEWTAKDGDVLYRVDNSASTLAIGVNSFTLPSGGWDVSDVVMEYAGNGYDIPLARVSRQDYLNLANKDLTGKPYMWYLDESALNAPAVVVYPTPDASCVFTYDYLRYVNSVTGLSETVDTHRQWFEAVCAELAARLALKFNFERFKLLSMLAMESYKIARRSGSGKSQVVISRRGFGAPGRQRRR